MKSVLVKDHMTRKVLSLDPDLDISAATQMHTIFQGRLCSISTAGWWGS